MDRDERQTAAFQWTVEAFGREHANSAPQRATRFIEEAIELYQSCGGDQAMLHRLVDFVFDKPPGELRKEIGDVGLTLLTVAELHGFSADALEGLVVHDALSRDPAEMRARNAAKNAAGFDAGAYPVRHVGKHPALGMPYGQQPFNERRTVGGAAIYERCACGKRFKRHCIKAMGDCDEMA